ncbi:MAG: hypothetical protein ACW9XA_07210 [Candidatus Nitrosopumilus sp. bin_6a]
MRLILIASLALMVVFSSTLPAFSQIGSRDIMQEYCQKNWDTDPSGCSEYIVNGRFEIPQRSETPQQTPTIPSQTSEIIKLSDDSITIILVGLAVIIAIAVVTFKIINNKNDKPSKVKQVPNPVIDDKKLQQKKEQHKQEEQKRWEQFQAEEKIRKKEYAKLEEERAMEIKNERKLDKHQRKEEEIKRKETEEKRKLEEIEKKQILEEKIKNNENLYDPSVIESLSDSASVRVFYDLEKKDAKYWKETDILDRIHIKDSEIRNEIKIKQNKITWRISVERGGKHQFAKLISGGNIDFWDHDVGGYTLQVHLSKPEEFLKAIIMKHIRRSNPSMEIHDSSHSITGILIRQDADHHDASNILKRVIEKTCNELTEFGDVLVE